jgi:Cu/Ag efflux pump CusA
VAGGHDLDKLIDELDRIGWKVPGLSNIWVPPIRNRIRHAGDGHPRPVGVKVAGTTWPKSTASRRRSNAW